MLPKTLDKTKLVHKPGIYIFKDEGGRILYVGKAIDLNKRISSYFRYNNKNTDLKTQNLVSQIYNVETIVVESELEALILEANLIKKYLPPFNIRLTDDKDYLYIKITKRGFSQVLTARARDLADSKKYFGPFPSSRVVKDTLRSLRRIFPWCASPPNSRKTSRPCFYYHLKLCPGPCVGIISQKEYNKIIRELSLLLEGKKAQLMQELTKEMSLYASTQEFEKASGIKKTIDGLNYLTQRNRTKLYLENPNFLQQEKNLSLVELKKILKLSSIPNRIECFDISNIAGKYATGSMVVLINGDIDKSKYRRFKISISGRPNDVAMHKEMMERRLKHIEWGMANLILIDGGRGQVNGCLELLKQANLNIPVFGLAKRMEWLYPPSGDIIKLPKRSLSLRLLQKIRDEAHRFAISYHKKLRAKGMGLI